MPAPLLLLIGFKLKELPATCRIHTVARIPLLGSQAGHTCGGILCTTAKINIRRVPPFQRHSDYPIRKAVTPFNNSRELHLHKKVNVAHEALFGTLASS